MFRLVTGSFSLLMSDQMRTPPNMGFNSFLSGEPSYLPPKLGSVPLAFEPDDFTGTFHVHLEAAAYRNRRPRSGLAKGMIFRWIGPFPGLCEIICGEILLLDVADNDIGLLVC